MTINTKTSSSKKKKNFQSEPNSQILNIQKLLKAKGKISNNIKGNQFEYPQNFQQKHEKLVGFVQMLSKLQPNKRLQNLNLKEVKKPNSRKHKEYVTIVMSAKQERWRIHT